jgi:hypothetical protein
VQHHHVSRVWVWAWVRVFLCVYVCVIFKTGRSCGFGYVLVTSFSKLEHNAKNRCGCGCGCGCCCVGVGVWNLPIFPSQVRNYLPLVCVSRIIFKTGKSCQVEYALVASFSNQENHANLVCIRRVIFKTGKSCRFGYALVASFSKQEKHANSGMH